SLEVAFDRGLRDVLAAYGFRVTARQLDHPLGLAGVGRFAGQAAQTAARGEPLPATSLAARAGGAIGIHDHVANLPGIAVGAVQELTAGHDAPADARSQRDEQ